MVREGGNFSSPDESHSPISCTSGENSREDEEFLRGEVGRVGEPRCETVLNFSDL